MVKNTGKVREFCQSGKVGTLLPHKLKARGLNTQRDFLALFHGMPSHSSSTSV